MSAPSCVSELDASACAPRACGGASLGLRSARRGCGQVARAAAAPRACRRRRSCAMAPHDRAPIGCEDRVHRKQATRGSVSTESGSQMRDRAIEPVAHLRSLYPCLSVSHRRHAYSQAHCDHKATRLPSEVRSRLRRQTPRSAASPFSWRSGSSACSSGCLADGVEGNRLAEEEPLRTALYATSVGGRIATASAARCRRSGREAPAHRQSLHPGSSSRPRQMPVAMCASS